MLKTDAWHTRLNKRELGMLSAASQILGSKEHCLGERILASKGQMLWDSAFHVKPRQLPRLRWFEIHRAD